MAVSMLAHNDFKAKLADVLDAGRTVFIDVAFEPNGQGQNLPISAISRT